jgi:hypothetical protein
MRNEEIVPVRHGTMSAFGTRTAETVGGGFMGAAKGALYWIAGLAIAGAVAGAMIAGGVAAAGVIGWSVGLGAAGAVLGTLTATFPAVLGGLFGAGKGYQQGRQRVNMERGAAQMMDMEIANAQMQMMAAAQQPRQTGTPAQGTRYNQAASTVQADSAARDGILAAGQQRQMA